MLTVDQYEYIRIAYKVYGKTIRKIARETGHSRNTVKKVLNNEHRKNCVDIKRCKIICSRCYSPMFFNKSDANR